MEQTVCEDKTICRPANEAQCLKNIRSALCELLHNQPSQKSKQKAIVKGRVKKNAFKSLREKKSIRSALKQTQDIFCKYFSTWRSISTKRAQMEKSLESQGNSHDNYTIRLQKTVCALEMATNETCKNDKSLRITKDNINSMAGTLQTELVRFVKKTKSTIQRRIKKLSRKPRNNANRKGSKRRRVKRGQRKSRGKKRGNRRSETRSSRKGKKVNGRRGGKKKGNRGITTKTVAGATTYRPPGGSDEDAHP